MSFEPGRLWQVGDAAIRAAVGLPWRAARRVPRLLFPRGLTPSERDFVAANRALWKELRDDPGTSRSDARGWLLVEPENHPAFMHSNASFAAICARSRGLRPLFILESHSQRGADRVLLGSYHDETGFVYLYSPRFALSWLRSWIRAVKVYRRLREPKDILDLTTHDGIRYGDLIYDALLTRGYATVRSIDLSTLAILQRYFLYEAMIASFLRRYDVRAYVTGQGYIGLIGGSFMRGALRERIEVFSGLEYRQLRLRKYRGPEEIGRYILRPEPQYLDAILNDPSGAAQNEADRFIEERVEQGASDDIAVKLAFNPKKRLFLDPADFAEAHGLDPAKPLVYVMLHEFTDAPHSHFKRPMLFQDYYDWFMQTLVRARAVRSVNWVIKEHPVSGFYPTKDLDLRRLFSDIDDPHIRFLPSDADFNAASLRYIAHAIVTCVGTAGMEYACFGIPCLLAGESPYSGFGFTVEPPDRSAYFRRLDEIAELPGLTQEQVRVARAVTWFELCCMSSITNLLCPRYPLWQFADFSGVDFWGDVARLLRTVDRGAVRRQIERLDAFIADDEYVQLVDDESYPFLRSAIDLSPASSTPA